MLAAAALLLAGCGAPPGDAGFEVLSADARWRGDALEVTVRQRLRLSEEAREALRHGVALTLRMDIALHPEGEAARRGAASRSYEIRYLPLSEHYQLRPLEGGESETFPRLRHVLARLGELRVNLETDAPRDAALELRVRTQLDASRLPAPMRLPALLSAAWRLDSEWTRWPLTANA
ncbi:MAG: DUF4390 domain-containing protein [Xanthomonadales bacterium]|nr:DUF4390 domain-containing protein [Xanthomonadales bacterium]